MHGRREGDPIWALMVGIIAAPLLGWLLIEGEVLVRVYDWTGLESLASRLIVFGALAVLFGIAFGFAFPRWWYLVPIAGASLDLGMMVRDFLGGGANLWPFALGIRVVWILLAFVGALVGRLVIGGSP